MLEDKSLVTSYADTFSLNLDLEKAYLFIIKFAEQLPGFLCKAGPKGHLKRFLFKDIETGKVPFAIVISPQDMLFYIRSSGIEQLVGAERMTDVMERLAPEEVNGELRFSIANIEQAKKAIKILFK